MGNFNPKVTVDFTGSYVKKVHEIASHRNGVSGNPFRIVRFTDTEKHNMIGIVFTEEPGSCAVLDTDLLKDNVIAFTENSWRGDEYEPDLRAAIKEWEAKNWTE